MKKIIIKTSDKKIMIPDGSDVLLVDSLNRKRSVAATSRNLSIIIGRSCRVQYLAVFDGASSAGSEEQREIWLGDASRLEAARAYFCSGTGRIRFISHLGKSAEMNSRVLFYQSDTETLQVEDNYIFEAPDSQGRFSVTGLLSGQAKAEYFSDIIIKPAAQGTDSRIDMKLYLLNKGAQGVMLPGLKIDANQVKAGHGASTFQLSSDDLFYLATRGLSASQAKALVIDSLAARFADELSDTTQKNLILKRIAAKRSTQNS